MKYTQPSSTCSLVHNGSSLTAAAASPAEHVCCLVMASHPAPPTLQDSGRPRRVLSFIGGIDLCDGRFDTHDHPLFRTLQLEHKRDFYQDCLPGVDGEAGGAWSLLTDLFFRLSLVL